MLERAVPFAFLNRKYAGRAKAIDIATMNIVVIVKLLTPNSDVNRAKVVSINFKEAFFFMKA